MPSDLNPILAAAERLKANSVEIQQAVQGTYSARGAMANANADLQLDAGIQDQIIAGASDQAALAVQRAKVKVGNAFGVNANDQGEVISETAEIIHASHREMRAAMDAISNKSSVDFFSDPITYIDNLFTINSDIARYNKAKRANDEATVYMTRINQLGDATARTQDQFKESITQAAVAANAKKISDLAAVQANNERIKAQAYNAESINFAFNMDKERLNTDFQALNAKNQQEQLGLALANYQLHSQEFTWRKEQHEGETATDEYLTDRMQKGLQVLYGETAPNIMADKKAGKVWVTLLKSNTPAGKEAVAAYMAGQSGVVAGTPSGAIDLIKDKVPVTLTPAQQSVKLHLQQTLETAGGSQEYAIAVQSKDKSQAQAIIDKVSKTRIDGMLKEIKPGDSGNIFNIGSLQTLLNAPAVRGDPITTKVLAPAVAAGFNLSDPSQVFATVVDGVKTGKININDAAMGLATVYQVGVKTNLAAKNLSKFGIVPGNELLNSYNARVQTDASAILGGSEIVNMTDPMSVMRAINKNLAYRAMSPLDLR